MSQKCSILSFSEDESFISAPRRGRTRYREKVSDIVSCLSDIHIKDDSDDDCQGDNEDSRTRECRVRLDKLTHDSLNELANGSASLFTDDEGDDDVFMKSDVRQRSCEVSLKKLTNSSADMSESHDSGEMEVMPGACSDRQSLICLRSKKGSNEQIPGPFATPVINKSISRLALDSFKVHICYVFVCLSVWGFYCCIISVICVTFGKCLEPVCLRLCCLHELQ